jgi:hypothetical protein
MKKSFFAYLLLVLSMMYLSGSNVYASMGGGKMLDASNSCRVTYSVDEGTLYVPCIKVMSTSEEYQFYMAELQQIPDTEPLQFYVIRTEEIGEENQNDACMTTYSIESEKAYLPCVDMVSGSSTKPGYMELHIDSSSSPYFFVADAVLSTSHRTRSNCPSSANYSGRTNGANLSNYGYKNPLSSFTARTQTGTFFTNPSSGYSYGTHVGVDYSISSGSSVYSVCNGKIVESRDFTYQRKSRNNSKSYWNSRVIVRCNSSGSSFLTIYGHVDDALPSGTSVVAGQHIANLLDQTP